MNTRFPSRPIEGGWATIACLAFIFSVCVWVFCREGELSFLAIFAAITACLALGTAIVLVTALVMKRFTRFTQILSRPVGRREPIVSLVTLFFVYYCVGLLPFGDTQDILYIGIMIGALFTFVAATAFLVVEAARKSSSLGEPSAVLHGGPRSPPVIPRSGDGPPSVSRGVR